MYTVDASPSKFLSRENQSAGLLRSDKWRVISMEFVHSFLRRHSPGEPMVATWNLQKRDEKRYCAIFRPRVKPVLQQIRLLQVAKNYCRNLQQNLPMLRFVPTQESEVIPLLICCSTDLKRVSALTIIKNKNRNQKWKLVSKLHKSLEKQFPTILSVKSIECYNAKNFTIKLGRMWKEGLGWYSNEAQNAHYIALLREVWQ